MPCPTRQRRLWSGREETYLANDYSNRTPATSGLEKVHHQKEAARFARVTSQLKQGSWTRRDAIE